MAFQLVGDAQLSGSLVQQLAEALATDEEGRAAVLLAHDQAAIFGHGVAPQHCIHCIHSKTSQIPLIGPGDGRRIELVSIRLDWS